MKTKSQDFEFYLSLLLTLLIFISSCKKEEIYNSNEVKIEDGPIVEEPLTILSFNSIKDFFEAHKKIAEMSQTEREVYEESKGYKSFGRLCDEFYNNIDPNEFNSIEEIKTFVSLNSEFLKLIEEENGDIKVVGAMYNDPTRYLINQRKIFIIDKEAFKVFNGFLVSTDIMNIEVLDSCNSESITTYKDNPGYFFSFPDVKLVSNYYETKDYPPPPYNFCSDYFFDDSVEGRDMTELRLGWNRLQVGSQWMFVTYLDIRAFKKTLGLWWLTQRTISWDAKWASDFLVQGFDWDRKQHATSGADFGYSIYLEEPEYYTLQYTTVDNHFGGFEGWGRTPSAPAITFQCRPDVIE